MKLEKLRWLSAIVLAYAVLTTGCAQLAELGQGGSGEEPSHFFNKKSHEIEQSLQRWDEQE